MPYTRDELKTVEFYQEFIQELRTKYLTNMENLSEVNFRKDGVLYSFEDIITGLGIEDVNVDDSLYSFLYDGVTGSDKRQNQFTVNNLSQRKYIKNSNLEKIIDRSISELSDSQFAQTLPEGIVNGDVVTNEITTDFTKWLIENNQKRIFPDEATFYGAGGDYTRLKNLTVNELNQIPDGEPVD
jgi:hypothetical protein|tara:strand:- start:673 stop:1224 length:552 start_codon:yes stop_codon:yes gene_type:complete